jgi:hypothetical protein
MNTPQNPFKEQLDFLFPDQADVVERIMRVAGSISALAKMTPSTLVAFTRIAPEMAEALINWAQAQQQATTTVVAEAGISVSSHPQPQPAAQSPGSAIGRIRSFARTANAFAFDEQTMQQLINFAAAFATFGPEVAQLDRLTLNALVNKRAASYIQDDAILRVANSYKNNKGQAASMPVGASTLQLVPEQTRVEYWREMNTALDNSGFYALVEQLAAWQRTVGKSRGLAKFANVQATISDARKEPDQLMKDHKKVVANLARVMQDRTRMLTAEDIAAEYDQVVIPLLTNSDFLYALVNPPRNVDPVTFFWDTDQLDLGLERNGLMFGEAVAAVIEALAKIQPDVPYEDQFETFMGPANDLYSLLEDMGKQVPVRYNIKPATSTGIAGIVQTLTAAIQVRVKVKVGADGSVQLEAEAGASVTTGPGQISGPDLKFIKEWLLAAFPTRAALSQLLDFTMNYSLEGISGSDLGELTTNTIKWAVGQNRLADLLRGAMKENKRSDMAAAFRQFAQERGIAL